MCSSARVLVPYCQAYITKDTTQPPEKIVKTIIRTHHCEVPYCTEGTEGVVGILYLYLYYVFRVAGGKRVLAF
jgi:hypothetical protein